MGKSVADLIEEASKMYDEFPPDSKGAGVIKARKHQLNIHSSLIGEAYFCFKRELKELSRFARRAYRELYRCFAPD